MDNKIENSHFVEKHIADCKSCSQFYDSAKKLEDKLIQDAKSLQTKAAPTTVDITKFKQMDVPVRHTTKIKSALLIAAACITIAVIFSAVLNIQKNNETKKLKQIKSQETLKFALSTHNLITDNIQTQDSALKLAQVMAKPYKNEIDTIKKETKTALIFLVSCIDVHIDNNQKNIIIN
jgi:predicted anti-sigma-YlaC factor YlaD